jgi:hypothetical protein
MTVEKVLEIGDMRLSLALEAISYAPVFYEVD